MVRDTRTCKDVFVGVSRPDLGLVTLARTLAGLDHPRSGWGLEGGWSALIVPLARGAPGARAVPISCPPSRAA